jgi:TP901 family phage tail tape measure protein
VAKEYPISIVLRAVDKATAPIRSVSAQIEKIGSSAAKVGKSLTTSMSLPLAAVGAASVAAFSTFEKGMANVSTLIDTSTESLDAMGTQVLSLGRIIPVELSELTGALYDLRSSGVSASDQFRVLENSAKLAVAGLGTTQEAADLVTSSINAFQLEGQDAQKVFDNIFKTTQFGKTTIAQLARGFGGVAGTVAATGTELDEYLASVAALTTTGLPAAEAHSQLRAVISGLTRDTKDSRKVFRALGAKDLKDLIEKSGGLVPALERISGSLGGNEAKILSLVGSTEALNAVLGLTGAQGAVFDETLRSMREGANSVDAAFEKQNATLAAQAQRTRNAMTSVGVSIGAILAPSLESIAGQIQKVADWFGTLDEGTRKWIVQIGIVVAAVGPAIVIVGKLASGLAALKTVFAVVGTAVRVLTMAMMANPIILIITGIAVAALLIYKYWEPIKAFFVRLWERIREPFMRFVGWVWNIFLNFSPIGLVIKHWGPITEFFAGLWDGVVASFNWAWERIQAIAQGIADIVGTVIDAARSVSDTVGSVGSGVASFFGADEDGETGAAAAAGGRLFGSPSLERLATSGTASTEASVKVEFANMPPGARATTDRRSTADVDLSVGYQMVTP